MVSKRHGIVLVFLLSITALASWAQTPSLKDAYAKHFLIGTALDFRSATEFSDVELALIKSQFNAITPENSMKPANVHPQEDTWNWTQPDALVKFCEENKITVIGHTLLWHSQTNPWFFQGENGQPVTKEKALERMKSHIMTLVGRYKGKIKGWDVVNEAINDSGPGETENLRSTAPWYRAVGPDYLVEAFKYAHEADPAAELHYNDYNIEKGNKHASSLLLLKRLIAAGAPITAVGIQGHWGLNNLPYEELDKAIADYKALGLKVMITELDITISGQGGGQLGPMPGAAGGAPMTRAGGPPTTQPGGFVARGARGGRGGAPATPEQLQAQADAYARFFQIFLKHKDAVTRVTFWGLNDRRTWRAGQSPLLFDNDNKPKPAFTSVIEVLAKEATTGK
jgi:GH35 family endo-1,4-beta-xylanase